ncbi:SRPBCC family protein [Pseudomonas sp. NFXW11]|uniref:SRPBCC family protein n=1 Tax=Pseudomonas sp. NFXW11 TaxID=2819531 RepID=UPI003CEA55D6
MSDIRLEIRVQAPADAIWNLWADFSNAPQWDTDVRNCTLDGPFQSGTRGLCVLKNGLQMPLVLEQVNPRRNYSNSARLLWARLTFNHYLTRIGAHETHVVHSVSIDGRLSFLYRGLLRALLRPAMNQALRNLGRLAEQRANQGLAQAC